MPATYEPIASTTLGSDASSITFSSVPSTYTDLVVVVHGAVTGGTNVLVRVGNGSADTGTNYSWTYLEGAGSAASSRTSNTAAGLYGGYANANASRFVLTMHLMSYANTSVNKTALSSFAATTDQYVYRAATLWRSTSAIDTVVVRTNTTNMASGTVASLYGVKAA